MAHLYYRHLATPCGRLLLAATDRGLCRVGFESPLALEDELAGLASWASSAGAGTDISLVSGGGMTGEAVGQLEQYFAGRRESFSLPLDLYGTTFQKQVWQALTTIPYGERRSYKQMAEAIGSPKAVRAVGGANNRNPIPIIIPCHRVVGADGSLTGYAGGLDLKQLLLGLEDARRN